MTSNILLTDSYKIAHHLMYKKDMTNMFSYFESRVGSKFNDIMFFGLQPILNKLYRRITDDDIYEAKTIFQHHFGKEYFNEDGWKYILNKHYGRLPLSIRAVPEGSVVDNSNILISVENTDEKVPWLVNYVEPLLSHIWYGSTVASLSLHIKNILKKYLEQSSDTLDMLPFQLHDFGFRGVSSVESAGVGGAAHLINFVGSDNIPAMKWAMNNYWAQLSNLGFSVAASEHSVSCSEGPSGEENVFARLLDKFPEGMLSIVIDSYNPYNFIDNIVPKYKERILNRNGKVVFRPDSITLEHPKPEDQVLYILKSLTNTFGNKINNKGFIELEKTSVLWGDGIDIDGINEICKTVVNNKWSSNNLVFGCGGGLLQKINRDTCRFAFKNSAIKVDGRWIPVQKKPLDETKASKAGRLKLIKINDGYETISSVNCPNFDQAKNELVEVFRDGLITKQYSFDEVRTNATDIWKGLE